MTKRRRTSADPARELPAQQLEDDGEPLIDSIDHVVITVRDLDRTIAFYTGILGMTLNRRDDRTSLHFGEQKLNLHVAGQEFEPRSVNPTPGSADLCLVTWWEIDRVVSHLERAGVKVIEGPVERDGANGKMTSVYFRDPDDNLLEISRYAL